MALVFLVPEARTAHPRHRRRGEHAPHRVQFRPLVEFVLKGEREIAVARLVWRADGSALAGAQVLRRSIEDDIQVGRGERALEAQAPQALGDRRAHQAPQPGKHPFRLALLLHDRQEFLQLADAG